MSQIISAIEPYFRVEQIPHDPSTELFQSPYNRSEDQSSL